MFLVWVCGLYGCIGGAFAMVPIQLSHLVAGGCVLRVGNGPTDWRSGNLDVGEGETLDL